MLDKNDYQEIAHLMKVVIESDVTPKFNLLAEGIQLVNEKLDSLSSESRIDDLETEITLLKVVIRQMNDEIQTLKKAQ